ncbi:MAG: hypothetical protein R3222_06470 [Balneolaceae bacterium]|nr:hypothetical protein [Balneolaceae bacterium]
MKYSRVSHQGYLGIVYCYLFNLENRVTGCVLLLQLLLLPLSSLGQPAGSAGSFTRIGFGPRGMALGNALTAVTHEGIYSYYNPAHAAYIAKGNQVDLSTSLMSFDRTLNSLNATFRMPPTAGISVSLLNAHVEGIDGRTASGYYTSDLKTNEYQLMTAFGIEISSKMALGIGVKLNLADFHPEVSPAKSVAFDAGAIYRATEEFTLGLTVRDLLASYSWNSANLYGDESLSETTEPFPVGLKLGASYRIHDIAAMADLGMLLQKGEQYKQLRVGLSWLLHERISLRGGWQVTDLENMVNTQRPSAGFSLHLPFDILQPSVDYAFVREPGGISSMHVFGLRMNL